MESSILHKQSNEWFYYYSETVQLCVLTNHTVISYCNDYCKSDCSTYYATFEPSFCSLRRQTTPFIFLIHELY